MLIRINQSAGNICHLMAALVTGSVFQIVLRKIQQKCQLRNNQKKVRKNVFNCGIFSSLEIFDKKL
jgi:hypothetical protein